MVHRLALARSLVGGENHRALHEAALARLTTPGPVEGATERELFETYVEEALASSLQSRHIVVVDNFLKPTSEIASESSTRH